MAIGKVLNNGVVSDLVKTDLTQPEIDIITKRDRLKEIGNELADLDNKLPQFFTTYLKNEKANGKNPNTYEQVIIAKKEALLAEKATLENV